MCVTHDVLCLTDGFRLNGFEKSFALLSGSGVKRRPRLAHPTGRNTIIRVKSGRTTIMIQCTRRRRGRYIIGHRGPFERRKHTK